MKTKEMITHDTKEKNPLVIVADDDNDLLQLVKMQLQKNGFTVELSPNGNGIMQKAVEKHANIILLDVTMDGISGEDICRRLKSSGDTASIPVIMFSANDNLETIAHNCGANDYVRKPFSIQAIKEKIFRYTT